MRPVRRFALIFSLFAVSTAGHALAQDPTPDDVQAAAAAFGEAQRAQLRGDYPQAADMFELADRSAPSPAALRSAIRSRRAAEQSSRAATLAADAILRYPDDAETRALADETLAELAPTLGAVHVTCTPACSLAIDGRAAHERSRERFEVFVDPGTHQLVASWGPGAPVSRELAAVAGQEETIAFEEPLQEAEEEEEIADGVVGVGGEPVPIVPTSTGLHPAIFGTLAGLAAVGLAVTIWSGVDTLDAASAYRRAPTQVGYNDGLNRELRTNVLIGVTAALGVTALVLAFFTDWSGGATAAPERIVLLPTFFASPEGATFALTGRF
jgi:hypothetical protein